MRSVIILFAKSPVAGGVKTRLIPPLDPEQAAALHEAFVSDMLVRFQRDAAAQVELHTDVLTDAWAQFGVSRRRQLSGGLQLKLFHGLQMALSRGFETAAIVGTDAPTLPVELVDELLDSSADVTLGPAEDGGFWGIGARRIHPNMFDGVEWSRSDTLTRTVRAVRASGLSCALGRTWFDVDEPADLERLLRSPLPPHTAEWAARWRPASDAVRHA